MNSYELIQQAGHSKILFKAMASSCEILLRSNDPDFCHSVAKKAVSETYRVEQKYSRYLDNNLVQQMNHSNGCAVNIDQETYHLLEYARNLYELSDGMFDITSGVLRKLWHFVPNAAPPNGKKIEALIKNIGFNKINYDQRKFSMPEKMEIDFGGIGKEYAVDQVRQIICNEKQCSFLINFGGDIAAECINSDDPEWLVGIEQTNSPKTSIKLIKIRHGGVATSGNSKRSFKFKGKQYGHLLNPKTGYPIEAGPLSITTFATSCVLAGSFSSLAMLQGEAAEKFLQQQNIKFICNW